MCTAEPSFVAASLCEACASPQGDGYSGMSIAKVTETLPFAVKREHSYVVYVYMNMETTNPLPVRVSRFFSDRYAYRTQPGYISELVAFGMIVFIAVWPIILVAHAMAVSPR
jgi:hypothetical protein